MFTVEVLAVGGGVGEGFDPPPHPLSRQSGKAQASDTVPLKPFTPLMVTIMLADSSADTLSDVAVRVKSGTILIV
jgi:hypothetical protein